jgi:hypothetical protein
MQRLYGDAVLSARRSAQRPSQHPQLLKHVALNVFYDRIVGAADDFAEAYQGRHGLIGRSRLCRLRKQPTSLSF